VTCGAIERGRHVVGDFARGGCAVVAALAVDRDTGMVETGRGPRQGAVARAAVLGRGYVIAGHRRRLNTGVTAATGIGHRPQGQIGVLHPDRREGVGRVARATVVVARDVAGVLAHGRDAVVATEAGASRGRVIHPDNGREVIKRVAQLTVVLRRDMRWRPWSGADSRAHGVAADAVARGAFENAFLMTVFARQIPVESLQLVPGRQMVELSALDCCRMLYEQQHDRERCDRSPEHCSDPLACPRTPEGGRVVTLLALRSEAPGVHVIPRMTRSADHRRLDLVLRPDMAVGAADLGMSTQQRETSVRRMIEIPHLPAIRRMAFAAILAETAVVYVVFSVTAHTVLGRIVEALTGMTLAATDDDMQAGERILRLIVIEVHFLPLGGRMALLALLAQRAAVRLVGAMAVAALRAQLLVLRHAGVAGVTVDVGVCAFEGEFETGEVIESRDAPDIVAMTVGTGGPHPACMLIVRLVTPGAILRYRILQVPAAMAVAAADACVAA